MTMTTFPAALIKRFGLALLQRLQQEFEDTGFVRSDAPDYTVNDVGGYGSDDEGRPDWVRRRLAEHEAAEKRQLYDG